MRVMPVLMMSGTGLEIQMMILTNLRVNGFMFPQKMITIGLGRENLP